MHEFPEGERRLEWGEEMFVLIDSLAEEERATPEEPVEEEAHEIDYEEGAPQALTHFSGFRQAFFEASQESNRREARRLGWSEYEWSQEVIPDQGATAKSGEEYRPRTETRRRDQSQST